MGSTIVYRFGGISDFIDWLEQRASDKLVMASAHTTRYKAERERGYAAGLDEAAQMLKEAKFGDAEKSGTELS